MIIIGRQLGKSNLQEIMIKQQSMAMRKSIDKMLIDEYWTQEKYSVHKSWKARNGTKMHRIVANFAVCEWLAKEHNQAGVSNPEWWKYDGQINITDKLLTLLVMRWS